MHPKETRDVVEVCCRQRIPAQLLFAGSHQPIEGRFVASEGESLWLDPVATTVPLEAPTACTICFQQSTSTVILLTTLLDVEAGPRFRFSLPTFAVIASGRQFFRVPVSEASRLLAMVSDDDQRWQVASPLDLSMGGLHLALFEAAPELGVGTRLAIDLVLDKQRARVTGRIVRRHASKLGIQLISASTDTREVYREIVSALERRWLSTVFEVNVDAPNLEFSTGEL
jgi:hypothetical protein